MKWVNLAAVFSSVLTISVRCAEILDSRGPGTLSQFTYVGSAGHREYTVYTPSGYSKLGQVPLIVVLHGCTQSSSIILVDSEFNVLAEEEKFIVAYINQTEADNYLACWDWWGREDQARGSGEPAIIAGIARTIQSSTLWNINVDRTYITGFSAGAGMGLIVGITYPDIFAAIGINSGFEYKSATTFEEMKGQLSTNGKPGPGPVHQGRVAYQAMGPYARRMPMIVFHGTADTVVPIMHGREVVVSMLVANCLADPTFKDAHYDTPNSNTSGQVPDGHAYTAASWNDVYGKSVLQYFQVKGMDHAWSGGAKPNVSGADMFTDPQGPSFTRISYGFFMANPLTNLKCTDEMCPL
ncbi:hypothetical protein APHAL10511_002328 [Amanita phalloides]|nr:hypothetical protein APHAL10511_002328 [Amanita phalloides]